MDQSVGMMMDQSGGGQRKLSDIGRAGHCTCANWVTGMKKILIDFKRYSCILTVWNGAVYSDEWRANKRTPAKTKSVRSLHCKDLNKELTG
jgi:hypothetical protein